MTVAEKTEWGWMIYLPLPERRQYIGCVEPVGKRFKAKLNARLVRSDAGPNGVYPTLEAAVKALEERE